MTLKIQIYRALCLCHVSAHGQEGSNNKGATYSIFKVELYKEFLIALKQKCKVGVQFCVYTFESAHFLFFFLLPSQCDATGKRSSKPCVGY